MRTRAVVIASLLASTACSSDGAESDSATAAPATTRTTTTTTTTTTTAPVTALDPTGCPVRDQAFCATATEAANALAAWDAGTLLELSRSDTINCGDVAREYFPGCEAQEVLDGYGLSGPDLLVDLVTRDAYADQLEAVTSNVDPSFADERGDGAVHLVGVGTCGPDEPGQRTYHLAWTAALRQGDARATRVLGSFEWLFIDDWRIILTDLGPLEEWEAAMPDPLADAFCAAGQNPWSA